MKKIIPTVCEDADDAMFWPHLMDQFTGVLIWKYVDAVATPSRAMEIAQTERDRRVKEAAE